MARPSQTVPNPGYDKTRALLLELGYRCNDQFMRSPYGGSYQGLMLPEDYFELYTGPRGCVIVQRWKDGHGCNVYTDWTVGHTFEEMRKNLAGATDVQWDDLTENERTARELIRRASKEPSKTIELHCGGSSVTIRSIDSVNDVNLALCTLPDSNDGELDAASEADGSADRHAGT